MKAYRASTYRSGFTLFEMCIVLILIVIFAGFVSAGLGSAFSEQGLREDASQLSFCIRSAQLRCEDENVPFRVTLTSQSVSLKKFGSEPLKEDDGEPHLNHGGGSESGDLTNADQFQATFHPQNQVWLPQDNKLEPWAKVKEFSWVFAPGHLCPVRETVRWTRGRNWMEETFDPLTGNIEKETCEFP